MKKKTENFSFEEALKELEVVVANLEDGKLDLEKSLVEFQRGIKLYSHCNNILKDASGKVKIIVEEEKNTFIEEEFETNF